MAHVLQEVTAEALGIVAVLVEGGEVPQTRPRVTLQDVVGAVADPAAIGGAGQGPHGLHVGRAIPAGEHLLEQRLRVTQAPFGLPRHQRDASSGSAMPSFPTMRRKAAVSAFTPMRRRS